MKAIILAAGRGRRMGPLTDSQPKCMVEVAGRKLLDWQMQACHEADIRDIGVVTGYRSDAFDGMELRRFHNPRWADTNMVRSLQRAASWLQTDRCVVSYSDIFYEAKAIRTLAACPAPLSILYDVNWRTLWEARFSNALDDAETFRIDDSGRLLEIGNRAQRIEEIQGQYMGLLHFSPEGWKSIAAYLHSVPASEIDTLSMTGLLARLITAGQKIIGVPYDGRWGEIDSMSDLTLAQRLAGG